MAASLDAIYQSDRNLDALDMEREEVHEFWLEHTPEGQQADAEAGFGSWFTDVDESDFFFKVVQDVQRFLYGDEGDAAVGDSPAPATDEEVTGIFDEGTYYRMVTYQDWVLDKIDAGSPLTLAGDQVVEVKPSDYLIFAGEKIPVEGDIHIVTMDEPGGLDLAANAKRKKNGKPKGFTPWPKPIMELAGKHWKYARLLGFVHWDAGWSAPGAYRALIRRGLGTNMGIDRPRKEDGKVLCYQWLDPGLFYGWHGGPANSRSVMSFDMSCAVYSRYAKKYEELCGIPRPLLKISSRARIGGGKPFLGMYRDQCLSLLRVLKALSKHTGMPYHWPVDKDGDFIGRNYKQLFKADFHGVAEHRHLPRTTKWDCRGLFAQLCVLMLTDAAVMAEFPEFVEAHRLHDPEWGPWLDKVKKHWKWAELWG
jgi:hypothetical protein